jgi:hypothetical protein
MTVVTTMLYFVLSGSRREAMEVNIEIRVVSGKYGRNVRTETLLKHTKEYIDIPSQLR